jgi:uncharacterized protein YjiS (DUF1127 family)
MIKAMISAYRKHATYRSTYKELSKLSDHELDDLGIGRYMIETVAKEAAYGKEKTSNFNLFKLLFEGKTEKDVINEYLSESANTIDLENRLRNVERGLAPWQIRARNFSQGWAQ